MLGTHKYQLLTYGLRERYFDRIEKLMEEGMDKKVRLHRAEHDFGVELVSLATAKRIDAGSDLLFDLPGRDVRNVQRKYAAGTSQCRHCFTRKWLLAADPCVLAGTARDDMGPTSTLLSERLVDVARIKGREDLVTVSIG